MPRDFIYEAAGGPDKVGVGGALARDADPILEGGAFGEGVGVVAEGFEEMEQKRLGFALFVAFKMGGKFSEVVEGAFL